MEFLDALASLKPHKWIENPGCITGESDCSFGIAKITLESISENECHLSNDKWQMTNVKCQMSNAKCQMSNVKCQMLNVKCQMTIDKWQMTNVKRQMSSVKRQVSSNKCQCHVTSHHVRSVDLVRSCRSQSVLYYNQSVQIRLAHQLCTDAQYFFMWNKFVADASSDFWELVTTGPRPAFGWLVLGGSLRG